MNEITLIHDLRILKRSSSDRAKLCQAGELLPAGTIIEVIDRHEIYYDHRFQIALRFDCNGDERFILEIDVEAMMDFYDLGNTLKAKVIH